MAAGAYIDLVDEVDEVDGPSVEGFIDLVEDEVVNPFGATDDLRVRLSRHPIVRGFGGLGLFARDPEDVDDPQVVFQPGDQITWYSGPKVIEDEKEVAGSDYAFELEVYKSDKDKHERKLSQIWLDARREDTHPGRYMNDPYGWKVCYTEDGQNKDDTCTLYPVQANAILSQNQVLRKVDGRYAVKVVACEPIYEGQEILLSYGKAYWKGKTVDPVVDYTFTPQDMKAYDLQETCRGKCKQYDQYRNLLCNSYYDDETPGVDPGTDVEEPEDYADDDDDDDWRP